MPSPPRQLHLFADLRSWLSNDSLADRLATIYETVDDIDLLVGAVAERATKGAFVGPTLACILGRQFQRVNMRKKIRKIDYKEKHRHFFGLFYFG